MIEIRDLSVTYREKSGVHVAVHDFTLQLNRGDICAVIGPSGCGKSTVLYVLSGIITQYAGSVLINGEPANPKLQRIGLIPQNYGLLEWLSVYGNAVLGLDVMGEDIKSDEPYINHILVKIGLQAYRNKFPGSLSGGQRQRVSIARAFIMRPDILLMDEPFSALDAITREEIQDLFLNTWSENKVSTIFVTHSIEEAVYIGRKIAIMSPAPGRIVKVLDNPLFGRDNLRMIDEYYRFSMELRSMAKEAWSAC